MPFNRLIFYDLVDFHSHFMNPINFQINRQVDYSQETQLSCSFCLAVFKVMSKSENLFLTALFQ